VPPSSKPLEFQGNGDPLIVHSVPADPWLIDRFGTYLVRSLPMDRLFTVNDLAAH
jgi:hypothetical protein